MDKDFKYDVFISYSRMDGSTASEICRELEKYNISYFIDIKGIGAGEVIPEVLTNAIKDSNLFLFLGSANSYGSRYCIKEVTYAEKNKDRNAIVPYLIDNTPLPNDLDFMLVDINQISKREYSVPELVAMLADKLKMAPHGPHPSPKHPQEPVAVPADVKIFAVLGIVVLAGCLVFNLYGIGQCRRLNSQIISAFFSAAGVTGIWALAKILMRQKLGYWAMLLNFAAAAGAMLYLLKWPFPERLAVVAGLGVTTLFWTVYLPLKKKFWNAMSPAHSDLFNMKTNASMLIPAALYIIWFLLV